MDKRILDLVRDIDAWKGDAYRLAALVAAQQRQIDAETLEAAAMPEAAALLAD